MYRVAIVAVASTLIASLAQAQGEPSVAARAKHFIVLDAGQSPAVGVGLRAGERTDLELDVSGRFLDDEVTSLRMVLLRPTLKRYLGPTTRSVAPYLVFGLSAEWSDSDSDFAPNASTQRFGGLAGVGVDWFPAQRVSVGGHIGVEALAVRRDVPAILPGGSEERNGYEIGTFASGVRFRLFF